jgi:hypothetical protein
MKDDLTPDWPQPQGIFEIGTKFNPANFLATLHNVYGQVAQGRTGDDLQMEFQAFIRLLHARLIVAPDSRHLFKLYALELPESTPSDLIVEYNGSRYMRVDYLRVVE